MVMYLQNKKSGVLRYRTYQYIFGSDSGMHSGILGYIPGYARLFTRGYPPSRRRYSSRK